jgi:hypothetical protein
MRTEMNRFRLHDFRLAPALPILTEQCERLCAFRTLYANPSYAQPDGVTPGATSLSKPVLLPLPTISRAPSESVPLTFAVTPLEMVSEDKRHQTRGCSKVGRG